MKLRQRPMQPEDIRECVDILASHSVVGPRYGPAIKHLPEVWLSLLPCEAACTVVVCADDRPNAPICFSGISLIVRDDFLREMKQPPHFWIGPELTRRIMRGHSPALSSRELREANSRDGLNLVCWDSCMRPEYEVQGEVHRFLMAGFIREHRGYLWKELISSQSWTRDHLAFILKTGGYLWDPVAGGYTAKLWDDPGEIVGKPHILGTTRDLELRREGSWAGSWVGALFDYHAPVLGFNRSEQRLLSCALPGGTDEQLAEMLGTSFSTVKNMWVSIYRRVEDSRPELVLDALRSVVPVNSRGRGKRRRLLAYLRDHPEELRPVSRKLLAEAAPT